MVTPGPGRVKVAFSEPVQPDSAGKTDNYSLSGGARITEAVVAEDGMSVLLTTSELADETVYTLSVSGVEDRSEAANAAKDSKSFTYVAAQPGLVYAYYEAKDQDQLTDREKLEPEDTGVVEQPDLSPAKRENNYALLFVGQVKVPADGKYTFTTASDDGSLLWINGEQIVDNSGFHGTEEKSGTVELTAGKHALRLYYYQGSGGAELKVRWKGPDGKEGPIPAEALVHRPGTKATPK